MGTSGFDNYEDDDMPTELMTDGASRGNYFDEEKSSDKKQDKPKKGGLFGLFKKKSDKKTDNKEKKRPQREVKYTVAVDKFDDDVTQFEEDDENTLFEEESVFLSLELTDDKGLTPPKNIELNLDKGYAVIGRFNKLGEPCGDFNFDYSFTFISRKHLRVEYKDDRFAIKDLGSTNGTFLNGIQLEPNTTVYIKPGDEIAFSKKTRLTYRVL